MDSSSSASRRLLREAHSGGLRTTVLPQANAGQAWPLVAAAGRASPPPMDCGSLVEIGSELQVGPKTDALGSVSRRKRGEGMARWAKGNRQYSSSSTGTAWRAFEAEDLAALTEALVARAVLRVETTATAALAGGDVDGP